MSMPMEEAASICDRFPVFRPPTSVGSQGLPKNGDFFSGSVNAKKNTAGIWLIFRWENLEYNAGIGTKTVSGR